MYYETKGVVHSDKIAAFDFDGTLAKTSLFQHGPDAWSVLYPNCLAKLAALNSNGYKLVIFTNQSAIGRAKSSREKTVAEKTSRLDGFIIKVHFSIVPSSTWTHLIKSKVLQGDMLNNGQNY